jgi:hypothetical protein
MKRTNFRKIAVAGLTFILSICTGPLYFANADSLKLTDSSENTWFHVSATSSKDGEVEFVWHSEAPQVLVSIGGDFAGNLQSESSNGDEKVRPVSNGDELSFVVSATKTNSVPAGGSPDPSPSMEEHFLTRLTIDNPRHSVNIFEVPAAQATPLAAKTYLRYQTFIPATWVEAPTPACTPDLVNSYVFLGDNRLFDPTSANFRTRFQVTVDWTANGSTSSGRYVGWTSRHKLDQNGVPLEKPDDTAQASNVGMVLTDVSNTSSLVHFRMSHSVTNPLCNQYLTKPIRYDADVWMARSGPYTINVSMQKVPNHELYIKDSDELNWKSLMQESTLSMWCLLVLTPDAACAGPTFPIPSGDTR